jgi:hypothetical protein
MSDGVSDTVINLLGKVMRDNAALSQRVEELSRKRARAEPEVNPEYMAAVCERLGLGPEVPETSRGLAEMLEAKLSSLQREKDEMLWYKTQSKVDAESARKERDASAGLLAEARRRQEMDRQLLEGVQKSADLLKEEIERLKNELEEERKRQRAGELDDKRRLERLEREKEGWDREKQQMLDRQAEETMKEMQSRQEAVDAERARTARHDAANHAAILKLRQEIAHEVGRREGIVHVYSRLVEQRMSGARQVLRQAVAAIKRASPTIPAEASAQMDSAMGMLDLVMMAEPAVVLPAPAPAPRPQGQPQQRSQAPAPPPSLPQQINTAPDYSIFGADGQQRQPDSPCYQPRQPQQEWD